MVSFIILILATVNKIVRPLRLSIVLLTTSILSTKLIYKECTSRWLPFVVIITFSSGIITLFIYATSITSNEKTKIRKKTILILIISAVLTLKKVRHVNPSLNIKSFSIQNLLILIAIILILTLLAVSSHGHHPNQTLNSSF